MQSPQGDFAWSSGEFIRSRYAHAMLAWYAGGALTSAADGRGRFRAKAERARWIGAGRREVHARGRRFGGRARARAAGARADLHGTRRSGRGRAYCRSSSSLARWRAHTPEAGQRGRPHPRTIEEAPDGRRRDVRLVLHRGDRLLAQRAAERFTQQFLGSVGHGGHRGFRWTGRSCSRKSGTGPRRPTAQVACRQTLAREAREERASCVQRTVTIVRRGVTTRGGADRALRVGRALHHFDAPMPHPVSVRDGAQGSPNSRKPFIHKHFREPLHRGRRIAVVTLSQFRACSPPELTRAIQHRPRRRRQ
jgi:hypothetical protein